MTITARFTALVLGISAATHAAAADGVREIFQTYRENVVAITYTLRPLEKPTGGEGAKIEDAICGVIVDPNGLIITSADPFPDPGGDPRTTWAPVEFKVQVNGGRPLAAEAVGMDRELNLAFLRIKNPPPGLRAIRFAEKRRLAVGEEVIVLGVMSRNYDHAPIFYTGLVNAVVERPRRMYSLDILIQDLAIGGLVVAANGEAIGVIGEDLLNEPREQDRRPGNAVSLLGSITQGDRVGYPMAFPYSLFAAGLASPPPFASEEKRSWLGIIMQPLNKDLIDYWNLDVEGGVIINSVVEGSPAEKAGLMQGDILIEIESEALSVTAEEHLAEFRRRIERTGVMKPVNLVLLRGGVRKEVTLLLGEAPKTAWTAREHKDDDLGLTTREITIDDLQGQNLASETSGVVVDELEQAGWCQISGLQVDDIVQSVDGHDITDLDSFRAQADRLRGNKPGQTVFFVLRQAETMFVLIKTPWTKSP